VIVAVQKAVVVKFHGIVHIETDRLIMRPFELSDAEALFEMESLPEVYKYLGMEPMKDVNGVKKYIEWIQSQYRDNGIGRSVVVLKENNKVIGWSGLKLEKEIRDFHYYDIGYRFHPDYWGKGIATESAQASLKFGFEKMGYSEICAAADAKNIASNKILEKIGLKRGEQFQFESTLCNWYSLNQRDFLLKS